MKVQQLLFSITILFLSLNSCKQQNSYFAKCETTNLHQSNQSIEPNELIKVWSLIDKKNIRRIILSRGPEVVTDNESIEVPQECLEGFVELLDKAIHQFKITDTLDIKQTLHIKIITDKNIFFIPGEWMINNKSIDSTTLWNYLMGCDVWKPKHITYDTNDWTKLHSLRKNWSAMKKENIRRIIFCEGGEEPKIDEWIVVFEVPQNCLKGAIRLLDKAMQEEKKIYRMPEAWMGFSGMKIITDKGKYLVPAEWPRSKYSRNKMIKGSDWASSELLEYLRKCGWTDPNN
jgi:hypothetical protein